MGGPALSLRRESTDSRRYGILVPAGPRSTRTGSITSGYLIKNGESELDLSARYRRWQALASVLPLTTWTTPVPYLVNAQTAASGNS